MKKLNYLIIFSVLLLSFGCSNLFVPPGLDEAGAEKYIEENKLDAPTGVSASYNSGRVYITWDSVSGADSYDVYYRANSSDGNYSYIDMSYGTSYYDYDIYSGNTYYYKIKAAAYGKIDSDFSDWASCYVP